MANTLFTVAILFFIILTIREWIGIFSDHPLFTGACVVIAIMYAHNTYNGFLDACIRVGKTTLVILLVCCFVAALVKAKEDIGNEK